MAGRRFWKMSGSGNDFVVFNALEQPPGELASPASIAAMCERRTGIGADGVVFLEPFPGLPFVMRYYNRDGTLAEMCGNAALCTTRLARELGLVAGERFSFETVSGPVAARFVGDVPEIDMVPVTELQVAMDLPLASGERRIGYARVGVPHLVILVDDIAAAPVFERGRELRYHASLRDGANVNFVGRRADGGWSVRTYERGVEEETLACGTGSVATVALLYAWGETGDRLSLQTRSGCALTASVPGLDGSRPPTLGGEGRIVFEGTLGDFVR
ncbi:MAG: diaminopimelate epimerase [Gemmatimonadaceae bacterium]